MANVSWKTTLIGWVVIVGDVVAFLQKTVTEQGLPSSLIEWITFGMALATGIGLILAKDRDVSGLPKVQS
jgi:NAD/NADP transhydrogenase beta subunit